jgi:uncharacterized protein (TIGR02271 family)
MTNTIVALYDDMDTAHQAVRALRDAGIANDRISLVAQDAGGQYAKTLGTTTTDTGTDAGDGAATGAGVGAVVGGIGGLLVGLGALAIPGLGPVLAAGPLAAAISALVGAGAGAVAGGVAGGLLGALVDMGVPEEEAGYYAEGVRRGGALLTVEADDQNVDRVSGILRRYNPVDINQRAATWRQQGWTGYDASAKPYTAKQTVKERDQMQKLNTGGEVRMPVVEEEIAVGKRQVEGGGVRVHRRVTETPVQQDVTLRQERVNVERRAVDRPADANTMDAFQEGSFEVKTTSEEPVVEKRARVTEEVVVNKNVDQRTEQVRDTVRRTDVDVEKTAGTGRSMGTGMQDMDAYRTAWRGHYQSQFANSGYKYEQFEPAYEYGYTLRNDTRYRDYDWNRLEPEARRTWDQQNTGTAWDQIKNAVRYAWENIKQSTR